MILYDIMIKTAKVPYVELLNWRKSKAKLKTVSIAGGPLKGRKFALYPEGPKWQQEMAQGDYENFLMKEMEKLANRKAPVIWDIGSHFGYHALSFAALIKDGGKVYAFEPNRFNISMIQNNIALSADLGEKISLFEVALSDHAGHEKMMSSSRLNSGESSGGFLSRATAPLDDADYSDFTQVEVVTNTIDSIVSSKMADIPDVLKIDVEGAESLVLKGAKKVLKKHKPVLLIEVHHILQMHEIMNMLLPLGYKIEILDRENAIPSRCFISAVAG